MRRVAFKQYVDRRPDKGKVPLWKIEETGRGFFHSWGLDFEDFGEHGPGTYSVGIIELDDGTVQLVRADFIRFV